MEENTLKNYHRWLNSNAVNEKDKEILRKRYGLITGIPATLDEIGQDLHLTRERVRQLEIKAMRKLRAPARVRALKEVV